MAWVTGEVDAATDGVLVITRIHVRYELRADASQRDVIERVNRVHARECPLARTLAECVDISTEVELIPR